MKKKYKLYLLVITLILMLLSFSMTILNVYRSNQTDASGSNSNQFFGEIVAIEETEEGRLINVVPAETPHPNHDHMLQKEIQLSAPEDVALSARVGPKGEKIDIQLGDLTHIYSNVKIGDQIAFQAADWNGGDVVEVESIIFTGGEYDPTK